MGSKRLRRKGVRVTPLHLFYWADCKGGLYRCRVPYNLFKTVLPRSSELPPGPSGNNDHIFLNTEADAGSSVLQVCTMDTSYPSNYIKAQRTEILGCSCPSAAFQWALVLLHDMVTEQGSTGYTRRRELQILTQQHVRKSSLSQPRLLHPRLVRAGSQDAEAEKKE